MSWVLSAIDFSGNQPFSGGGCDYMDKIKGCVTFSHRRATSCCLISSVEHRKRKWKKPREIKYGYLMSGMPYLYKLNPISVCRYHTTQGRFSSKFKAA